MRTTKKNNRLGLLDSTKPIEAVVYGENQSQVFGAIMAHVALLRRYGRRVTGMRVFELTVPVISLARWDSGVANTYCYWSARISHVKS